APNRVSPRPVNATGDLDALRLVEVGLGEHVQLVAVAERQPEAAGPGIVERDPGALGLAPCAPPGGQRAGGERGRPDAPGAPAQRAGRVGGAELQLPGTADAAPRRDPLASDRNVDHVAVLELEVAAVHAGQAEALEVGEPLGAALRAHLDPA